MKLINMVAIAVLFSIGFGVGWQVQDWRKNEEIAKIEMGVEKIKSEIVKVNLKAKEKANKLLVAQNELSLAISEKQALEEQKSKVVTKYITKRVIEYVKSPKSGKCDLPNQWVYVHDAAAVGMSKPFETAKRVNDTPFGITDIEALEVATNNYKTCLETATRLKNLQLWATRTQNVKF